MGTLFLKIDFSTKVRTNRHPSIFNLIFIGFVNFVENFPLKKTYPKYPVLEPCRIDVYQTIDSGFWR